MALMINDLEKNLELSASEMADVNGGWGYPSLPGYPYREYPYLRPVGVADAQASALAIGVNNAFTFTDTFSEVGPGSAVASSVSQSHAS